MGWPHHGVGLACINYHKATYLIINPSVHCCVCLYHVFSHSLDRLVLVIAMIVALLYKLNSHRIRYGIYFQAHEAG